jgi:hypothetical protein
MSTPFYDLASLVVVPSGYKSGKIYAQKPLTTDGQLTFTRASTATRVNASGLIETVSSNVPRLDYSGGATCPKLLLEPSRTNLVVESSGFNLWSANAGATVDANATTGPDGTLSADRLNMTAAGSSGIYSIVTTTNGVTYTQSIYIKGDSNATNVRIGTDAFPSTAVLDYNAVTGEIVQTGGGIISTSLTNAANGFKRLTWTFVSTGSISSFIIYNVSGNAGSLFLYGAQQEAGAYPTSLINTTSAAVTRLADSCSKSAAFSTSANWTLFAEFDYVNGTKVLDATFTSSTGRFVGFYNWYGAFRVIFNTGGGAGAGRVLKETNGKVKVILQNDGTDCFVFVNGVKLGGADSAGAMPITGTLATISYSFYAGTLYDTVKGLDQFLLFNSKLTDAQCIELSTL